MAKFLINKGIVKNEKQARGILLTIIMVFLIASVYIFATSVLDIQLPNQTPQPVYTPEEMIIFEKNNLI